MEKLYSLPSSFLNDHNIDSIVTLGFPIGEHEYLAIALEYFLIQKLNPRDNIIYREQI